MADDATMDFLQDLVSEVEESVSAVEPFTVNIFTAMILERLEEAGHFDETFPVYQAGHFKDKRGRNIAYRIDGYAYEVERGRLDLFTTIFSGDRDAARIPAADVTKALERALRFASACVDGLASSLEPANTDASDLARLIEAETGRITSIRVVLLTDGTVGDITSSADWKGKPLTFKAYDITRLFRVLGKGETREDISVDIVALAGRGLQCLHVPAQNDDYDAYLSVLPGKVLSQVYERYGVRLLELNVRAFLGLQGRKSVNAELRETIVKKPTMFLAYNNGIVATVDDLEVGQGKAGLEIRSLKGLQIVNGGQTTASLHRAGRRDSDLEHVSVPVKIIKVGGADLSEMVSAISRAANRQNTVQLADFSANDPFHQQVEVLANTTWLSDGKGRWFYERARGAYLAAEYKAAYRKSDEKSFRQQTPKHRRLSKLDVARYLSVWSGLPDKVCLGGQKNFQYFMQRLKDEPLPPPDQPWFRRLIALAVLYRAAEKKIRSMKFPAYGAQITAYVVAGLSHRTGGRIDFEGIWSRQAITPEMERLIGEWASLMDTVLRESAGQKNPSEWFKKPDCWKSMQDRLPPFADPLPQELSYAENELRGEIMGLGEARSVVDYERIARCMEVSGAIWLEVAERGQKAGVIHYRVAGICRTLAGYAVGGWEKKPTVKQARPALEALDAVEKAGLMNQRPQTAGFDEDAEA
ncbi:AIPR protein [Phyllobacterium myrsinacearum]|uniref:AIPR family protein n=1 Tax=Phyllobacterium myrsinacearum TaxID=28101 RepID=UPI001028FFBD|nr:AIPR family protein [Phyllobacterium myrsinacearum]RZS76900.1 AIPR protein [Phyllobacterium myrsinacearum]